MGLRVIILSAKGFPTPAVVVLLIAALSVLEQRGGWWLIAGVSILAIWAIIAAVQIAFMSLHDSIAAISDELEDMLVDMEDMEDSEDGHPEDLV